MKAVVLVSADTEWRMIRGKYPEARPGRSPFGEYLDVILRGREVRLFQGGWGKISAAASTQYVLDHERPDLLVNLGTCGGLRGRVAQGAVILVEKTLVYDLVEQMTDGAAELAFYTTELDLSWLPRELPHAVLRGLMVSGDRDIVVEDIPGLVRDHGAIAADWESAAIAWVAARGGARTLILRGVSDLVGADGGEAYGNHGLFAERTREIMDVLLDQLPDWLESARPALEA
ncbi:MAG TPA: 5'-methylthioadenosine/S-adenosylhomocysteine nucleosidase [Holophaga sp.]|nr:5'-methylthioadenosine/S-adenosylhomocysteine nucleosidase [Holophaga sp.]HPS66285.1 5'-methylthioadenosine/S-adenosylhomocysteine nucleosidase [Holophaga sp.]